MEQKKKKKRNYHHGAVNLDRCKKSSTGMRHTKAQRI